MIRFASVFSDYAVLQRRMPIPVWGTADPRTMVEVRFRGECRRVLSTPDGRFLVRFPPGEAGGPFVLEAELLDRGERRLLKEIMVGEVWLASGQSNMAMSLDSVGPEAAADAAKCDSVRMLTVPCCARTGGRAEFRARWMRSESGGGVFSAAAFYFAREVAAKLGVTVGILHSSWGGTDAMAWCSREALLRNPDFRDLVLELEAEMFRPERWSAGCDRDVPIAAHLAGLEEILRTTGCPENDGFGKGWAAPEFDDSGWKRMNLPNRWNRMGEKYNGVLWFRREVEIPADWEGRPLTLAIGAVDKHDVTYFNGVQVGATGSGFDTNVWCEPREYPVPPELVRAGRAVIAVRAYSFLFDGGLIGPADAMLLYPLGEEPEKGLKLSGEWRYATEFNMGIVTPPPVAAPEPGTEELYGTCNMPCVLYDNMIAPLIPYAMRGVIWYQGEHNTLRRNRAYGGLMRALIDDWRRAWGQGEFPFYQVQLPGYHAGAAYEEASSWARLRVGQQFAAEATGNDFAVTLDLGDGEEIHPKRKREVGERLARLSLRHEYGVNLVENGPMPLAAVFEGEAVRLRFRRCAEGLRFDPGPTLFAVAGADGKFRPVEAEITGDGLLLPYSGSGRPRRLRYAWADNPQGALLRNGAGLPAPTFELEIL